MAKSAPIKFGVMIPQGWRCDLPASLSPVGQYDLMRKVAAEIERLGFYSGFLYDHLHTFPTVTTESCFECFTTLSALATATDKLRLGQLVTCNSYRNPALLAKMAATFDVISKGRLEFGIGAGWYEHEYSAYGYPFPRPAVRIRQLREAVEIIKKMWTEEKATFRGRYHSIDGAINSPRPVQKPHPPIIIGGTGEKLTLRVVAELADKCNFGLGNTPEQCARKLDGLRGYCSEIGRSFDSIEKTLHREVVISEDGREATRKAKGLKPPNVSEEDFLRPRIVGDPDACAKQLDEYIKLGFTYFILYFHNAAQLDPLRLWAGEVVPRLPA